MKYREDLSIKDISKAFDKSESAIKMKLKRAKNKVRKLYNENFDALVMSLGFLFTFM